MHIVNIRGYAKINLTLDICGKRLDGYHLIDTIMQTIDIYDEITIELNDSQNVTISCTDQRVPCDITNIAYKCARTLLDRVHSQRGCHIHIVKTIPMQAGLGGGSADGAAVLQGLNLLLQLGYGENDLIKIGSQIGADIPFCIYRGTALCEGIGDVITPLPKLREHYVVIVKPDFGVSTPEAYSMFDKRGLTTKNSSKKVIKCIFDKEPFYGCIANDLERALSIKEILRIKSKLRGLGALTSQMSGSGSSVFGLFDNLATAREAFKYMSENYECYITTTL